MHAQRLTARCAALHAWWSKHTFSTLIMYMCHAYGSAPADCPCIQEWLLNRDHKGQQAISNKECAHARHHIDKALLCATWQLINQLLWKPQLCKPCQAREPPQAIFGQGQYQENIINGFVNIRASADDKGVLACAPPHHGMSRPQ